MSKDELYRALKIFGREDLTDGLYENDIDDNVQVFLTIRQMIKLYNLQSKIDKAIEYIDKWKFETAGNGACMEYEDIQELLNILEEDK